MCSAPVWVKLWQWHVATKVHKNRCWIPSLDFGTTLHLWFNTEVSGFDQPSYQPHNLQEKQQEVTRLVSLIVGVKLVVSREIATNSANSCHLQSNFSCSVCTEQFLDAVTHLVWHLQEPTDSKVLLYENSSDHTEWASSTWFYRYVRVAHERNYHSDDVGSEVEMRMSAQKIAQAVQCHVSQPLQRNMSDFRPVSMKVMSLFEWSNQSLACLFLLFWNKPEQHLVVFGTRMIFAVACSVPSQLCLPNQQQWLKQRAKRKDKVRISKGRKQHTPDTNHWEVKNTTVPFAIDSKNSRKCL